MFNYETTLHDVILHYIQNYYFEQNDDYEVSEQQAEVLV